MTRRDLEQRIVNHQRRLQKLKEQQALHGISVDPKIPLEIENIEAELAELQAELAGTISRPDCPYRGLFAFREADAPFFFGREVFTDKLVKAVQQQPLVAVLGASGSGKSSVVFAGLVPQLRRVEGRLIAAFRPGPDPFLALATTLLPLYDLGLSQTAQLIEARTLAKALSDGVLPLADVVTKILKQEPTPSLGLLLIADQFEELYTLCPDPDTRRRFLDLLIETVQTGSTLPRPPTPLLPCTILLTLRADFLGQALSYRPFADALQSADVKLGPMTHQELAEAIEKPAQKQNVTFEAGLAERILADVGDEPGNLPLLEFALTELWAQQSQSELTHMAYEAIGRVTGALTHYADEVFTRLNQVEQTQTRRALIRMVQPGEGTEDTRRLVSQAELGEVDWLLVQKLADARLVVTNRDAASQETVEVVHEALIQNWGRLRGWLDEDRAALRTHRRLTEAAEEWQRHKRDESYLYSGARLAEADDFITARADDLNELEREFVQVSVTSQRARQIAARRRTQWIIAGLTAALVIFSVLTFLALQQRNNALHAEATADARRLESEAAQATVQAESTRAIKAESTAVAEATRALNAEATAEARRLEAEQAQATAEARRLEVEQQNRIALSRQLAAQTLQSIEVGSEPEVSLLLAIEAVRATRDANGKYTRQAEDALRRALDLPILATFSATNENDYIMTSSDFRRLLFGHTTYYTGQNLDKVDAAFKIFDLVNHKELTPDYVDKAGKYLLTPDGQHLVALSPEADGNGTIISFWDLENNREVSRFNGKGDYYRIKLSPNGKYLLMEDWGNSLFLYDIWDGEEVGVFHDDTGASFLDNIAFSPNSKFLTLTSDIREPDKQIIAVLDGSTLEVLFKITNQLNIVKYGGFDVAFSSNGNLLAAANSPHSVTVWEVPDGKELTVFTHTVGMSAIAGINDIAFSPDNSQLAIASVDGVVRLWDIQSGQEIIRLTHPQGSVETVAFSPEGSRIATSSSDATRIWEISTQKMIALFRHSSYIPEQVRFSEDGRRLLTIRKGGGLDIRLWDASGEPRSLIFRHDDYVHPHFVSKNRLLILADNTSWLINAFNGDKIVSFKHNGDWSKDFLEYWNNPLAVASKNGTAARLIDTTNGQEQAILQHDGSINSIAFGKCSLGLPTSNASASQTAKESWRNCIATASSDYTARLWDASTAQQLVILQHQGIVSHTVFDDYYSRYLATFGTENGARLWDTSTGKLLAFLHRDGVVNYVTFYSECDDFSYRVVVREQCRSKYVVTASADKTARLWDTSTGQLLAVLQHGGAVKLVRFLNCRLSTATAKKPEWCGRRLWTVSDDGVAHLWSIPNGEELSSFTYENSSPDWDYAPTSNRLVSENAGGADLIDISTGKILLHFGRDWKLSPDGTRLLIGNYLTDTYLVDTLTGNAIAILHSRMSWDAQFSDDGSRLVIWPTSTDDNRTEAYLWKGNTGQKIANLSHEDSVGGAVFNSDGGLLATYSANTVHLWNSLTGQELALIPYEVDVSDIFFGEACDSKTDNPSKETSSTKSEACFSHLFVETSDHAIYTNLVYVDDLLERACSALNRNLTHREWQRYLGDIPYHRTCANLPDPPLQP